MPDNERVKDNFFLSIHYLYFWNLNTSKWTFTLSKFQSALLLYFLFQHLKNEPQPGLVPFQKLGKSGFSGPLLVLLRFPDPRMAKKKMVTNCRYWNWFDLVLGATGLADLTIQLITRDSALVCPRYGSFLLDVHIEGVPPGCRTGGENAQRLW